MAKTECLGLILPYNRIHVSSHLLRETCCGYLLESPRPCGSIKAITCVSSVFNPFQSAGSQLTNSADPGQMPHNAAADQGLRYLH